MSLDHLRDCRGPFQVCICNSQPNHKLGFKPFAFRCHYHPPHHIPLHLSDLLEESFIMVILHAIVEAQLTKPNLVSFELIRVSYLYPPC